jgi:hypothetical protein
MAITVGNISTNWSLNTDTEVLEGEQYRLRAGAPMPTMGGGFVIHTFMAEANKVLSYLCTEQLPGSHQFRGQGGSDNYISANFSRLNITGGNTFQGKIVKPASPQYIDEGGYGFN